MRQFDAEYKLDANAKQDGHWRTAYPGLRAGAAASGQAITATVNFGGPDAEELRQAVQALVAIQAELSGSIAPVVELLVGTAKQEMASKDEIGNLLDTVQDGTPEC